MKKIFLLGFAGILAWAMSCTNSPEEETIEVVGSADRELTPDIIYVGISLREYFEAGNKRVPIEKLEAQLQAALAAEKVDPKNLLINNISSYQDYYNKNVTLNSFPESSIV